MAATARAGARRADDGRCREPPSFAAAAAAVAAALCRPFAGEDADRELKAPERARLPRAAFAAADGRNGAELESANQWGAEIDPAEK